MIDFNKKLKASGELVSAEGLAWPSEARLVRATAEGLPDTDGVFPETKEFLVGFWIVDVEERGTRLQDCRRCVRRARRRRSSAQHAHRGPAGDVRTAGRILLMTPAFEHLLRDTAPRVLGALVRRYRDFASAEDAVQEALLAAATRWPREGAPDNAFAWLFQVASRRLTDQIRSDTARRRRETEATANVGRLFDALCR